MRDLRQMAVACLLLVVLATSTLAGEMQAPGYVPPPPPPPHSGSTAATQPPEISDAEMSEAEADISVADELLLGLLQFLF